MEQNVTDLDVLFEEGGCSLLQLESRGEEHRFPATRQHREVPVRFGDDSAALLHEPKHLFAHAAVFLELTGQQCLLQVQSLYEMGFQCQYPSFN